MSNRSDRINEGRRACLASLAAGACLSATPRVLLAVEQIAPKPTALVIGAGIAGLSAAWELRKAGFDVTVFEKEDFTGGRMREGWMGPLYQFTHAVGVLEANREMFDLADELGIRDELEGEPFADTIENGHGTYPYTLDFHPERVARIPGMSAETRRRLPSLQADLDRIREAVDPCLLHTGAAWDDESLGAYYERVLGREAGREVIRYWVQPVCSAAGWPVYETSKMALLPWFSRQEARFVYPRGGIGVLTRKLGSLLPVHNNTTVRYVTPPGSDGRHTVHYLTPTFERRSVTPDIVVCAVEGKYLDKIVQDLTPKQRALAENTFFSKEAIVCYMLDEADAPAELIGGSYIPTHPDPVKAKTSYWFVTPGGTESGGHPPHARYALSRQETPAWQRSGRPIEEYCLPMMSRFYPRLTRERIRDIVNYTCDDLIYMPVGYIRRIADVLQEQERERRGLYFAGEYVSGGHTGAACASGRTVGRMIAAHWS